MKTKVYLQILPNFSKQLEVRVLPVTRETEVEEAVMQEVLKLLEDKLGAIRTEVLEGLDQSYIDYDCKGIQFTLGLDPYSFISLQIDDEKFRKEVFDHLSDLFEAVPLPPQDGDDE